MPDGVKWEECYVAAAYLPSTMEDRLRVMAAFQAKESPGEYDRYLDMNTLVWVRRPTGALDDVNVIIEIYTRIAAATLRLLPLITAKAPGIIVLDRPDKQASDLLIDFTNQMTQTEFANRYVPEP